MTQITPLKPSLDEDRANDAPAPEAHELVSLPERGVLSETETPSDRRFRLALGFAAFNLAPAALLGAAYAEGWVDRVVAADASGISLIIFAVFLAGLALCAHKVWRISGELNCARGGAACERTRAAAFMVDVGRRSSGSRAITGTALRTRVFGRIAVVRHVANSLVLLGLIGTVVGFIMALSGVDPGAASEVRAVPAMVANLIQGMSVSLYTTLVGAVLNLWLMADYHILAGGAVKLVTAIIALGEANAGRRYV